MLQGLGKHPLYIIHIPTKVRHSPLQILDFLGLLRLSLELWIKQGEHCVTFGDNVLVSFNISQHPLAGFLETTDFIDYGVSAFAYDYAIAAEICYGRIGWEFLEVHTLSIYGDLDIYNILWRHKITTLISDVPELRNGTAY